MDQCQLLIDRHNPDHPAKRRRKNARLRYRLISTIDIDVFLTDSV
jgi:hypothetical protein